MPATPQSRVSSRHRCTEIVRIIDCTSMDVAIAGDRCALHLYSPHGTTQVLLPTDRFVESARGPVDCNRNPFPRFAADVARESAQRFVADASLAEATPAARKNAKREMDPDRRERFVAARNAFNRGLFNTKRAACEFYGVAEYYSAFIAWTTREALEERISDGVAPILKPGGKIL